MNNLKPRRRVLVSAAAGDVVQRATLVRTYSAKEQARSPHLDLSGWWIVRFDHGGRSAVHQDSIRPAKA